ncbi:hypothetical protein RJ640_019383 [Escallonia rubra]|uniref:Uncharacterized protein n=1 Tax=Escallonia rubra TaxID=112253 RepID=A0AA88RV88_9ASTE|nr:hypothetical protein RJ640_019383 [Escallonia rubra]
MRPFGASGSGSIHMDIKEAIDIDSIDMPLSWMLKSDSNLDKSIKMKTLFKSQDLWELVENGYADPDEENNSRLKENKKKYNKALLFIQQAVHETLFSRIAAATTSSEAWEILHKEFQGSSKVINMRLQSLRREFETLFMRNNDFVQDFLSRVIAIVGQMKSYGEQITDEIVVVKVLRSLTPTFDHVITTIEESKDLTLYAFDELMGALCKHMKQATLMNVNEKLKIGNGTRSIDGRFFRNLVGGLIYLTHTRPDIAFSVGVVSRFMHNPTAHHLGAAKWIMHYIAGTRDFGLRYSKVSNFILVRFSDNDWAGCLDDRRSTSGSTFNLGSGAITWTSKRQATAALSSSEAEYIAATSPTCQAVLLRKLLADLLQD